MSKVTIEKRGSENSVAYPKVTVGEAIDDPDDPYDSYEATGRVDSRSPSTIEYFPLEQHPDAKAIYDKFDPNTLYENATLADVEHFNDMWPAIEFYLFFKQAPSKFSHFYTFIDHNIRSFTLYTLANSKKIDLYAFDSTAALSALKIAPEKEVLTPAVGRFVISMKDNDGNEFSFILELERGINAVEWIIYTKNSAHYSIFDRMFRKAIPENNYYKGKVFDNHGNFLNFSNVTFDDIYLANHIKKGVQRNIIDYIDPVSIAIKQKNGIPTKRGVIFAGAPGTGKTYLARVLANTLNTTFMVITSITSINDVTQVFDLAKQFDRIVLLFEDIDIYIKDRDFGSSLLPTMLNKLDGMEVNNHTVVLCTTNDVKGMDEALKNRPGRFDCIFTFEPPTKALKEIMLKGFCKDKDVSKVNFESVINVTPPKFTGAHLKEIFITACNEAIEASEFDDNGIVIFTTDRFIHAVNSVKGRKELSRIGFASGDNTNTNINDTE